MTIATIIMITLPKFILVVVSPTRTNGCSFADAVVQFCVLIGDPRSPRPNGKAVIQL